MNRLSALRNMPVICGEHRMGLLQGICLDTAQKRVDALVLSSGLRGKRIVKREQVISIAEDFILIRQAGKFRRTDERKPCRFVRDTTGLLTGRVRDYAIDEASMNVLAIEIVTGYTPLTRGNRIWVYDYTRSNDNEDELTVPASLGSELMILKEGIEECACLP